jgi:hypothetical protein
MPKCSLVILTGTSQCDGELQNNLVSSWLRTAPEEAMHALLITASTENRSVSIHRWTATPECRLNADEHVSISRKANGGGFKAGCPLNLRLCTLLGCVHEETTHCERYITLDEETLQTYAESLP